MDVGMSEDNWLKTTGPILRGSFLQNGPSCPE